MGGELYTAEAAMTPRSVTYMVQTELHGNYTAMTCSERAQAAQIVDFLIGANTSLPANISCNGTAWVVSTCTNISQVSICNGCNDPCSGIAASYDSSGDTYPIMNFPDECSSQECHHSLIIDFAVPYPAALVQNIMVPSIGLRSLSVRVTTDSRATVYCSALKYAITPASLSAITSVASVNNTVAYTNSSGDTNIYADLSLSGLFPAANYTVYCVTKSIGGTYISLASVIEAALPVYTECCKQVYLEVETTAPYSGTNYADFYKLTLETIPEEATRLDFEIVRYASGSSGTVIVDPDVTLAPSSFTFDGSSDAKGVLYMALLSSSQYTEDYTYTVRMNETKLSRDWYIFKPLEYTLNLVRGDPVLYGSSSLPPVPSIVSAEYAVDGTYVAVTFDSSTNKGGLPTVFSCTLVMAFDGASSASCSWADSYTIKILPASTSPRLVGGGQIQVLSAPSYPIRAACDASAAVDCSLYPSLSYTVLTVTIPNDAVSPYVIMTSPSSMSYCDDLRLDLSATTGSAGQAWKSVSVSVESSGDATNVLTVLQNEAEKIADGSQVYMLVPYSNVTTGTWAVSISICNFLDRCGTAQASVLVIGSLLPNVQIDGAGTRNIKRGDSLDLRASAYVPSCNDDSISRSGISFSWGVYLDNVLQGAFVSTSKNPYKFSLGGYALNTGKTYEFRASAVYDSQGTSAFSSVEVNVEADELVPSISGASERSVKLGETITVDGSGSYDLEFSIGERLNENDMHYAWSCETLEPTPSQMCAVTWDNATTIFNGRDYTYTTLPQPILKGVPNSYATSDMVLRVTLTITKDSRIATTTVKLKLVPVGSTIVDVTAVTDKKDASKKIYLYGTVSADYESDVEWSIDADSGYAMADVALSSYTGILTPIGGRTRTKAFNLVLLPNGLGQDATFTFTLTSTLRASAGTSSYASVSVTTNGPPTPGSLALSPSTGYELSTSFLFTLANWADDDVPLQYEFGYVAVSTGKTVSLGGRSSTSYYSAMLPAGNSNSSAITCIGVVLDTYSAKSKVTATVYVERQDDGSSDAEELGSTLTNLLDAASDVPEESKSALALASGVLNRVDCSEVDATSCLLLNREVCSVRENLCGACLSGYVSGENDYGNTRCVPTGDFSRRRLTHDYGFNQAYHESHRLQLQSTDCTYDDDCASVDIWAMCFNGICSVPSKSCPGNCSSAGTCNFVNKKNGLKVDVCLVSDPTCEAVCFCTSGFGLACGLTLAESLSRAAVRLSMIEALEEVVAAEDASTSMESWITLLLAITEDIYDLSRTPTGVLRTLSLAETILTEAVGLDSDNRLEASAAADLLTALNNLMGATSSNTRYITGEVASRPVIPGRVLHTSPLYGIDNGNVSRRAFTSSHSFRMLTQEDVTMNDTQAFSTVQTLFSLTEIYGDLIASDMAAGEFSTQTVTGSLSTTTQVISVDSSDTLVIGSSVSDSLTGDLVMSRLTVPVLDSNESSTLGDVEVSITEMASSMYGNISLNANPVRLYLDNVDSSLENDSTVFEFVLANIYDVDMSNYSRVIVQPCYNRRPVFHTFGCPGHFPNVSTQCNGSAYEVTLRCPSFYHQSVCTTLSTTTTEYGLANCTVSAYNATTTSCSCPLSSIVASAAGDPEGRRRRALSTRNRELAYSSPFGGDTSAEWDGGLYAGISGLGKRRLSDVTTYSFDISVVDTTVTTFYNNVDEMTPWPDLETPSYLTQYGLLVALGVFCLMLLYGTFADKEAWDILTSREDMDKAREDFSDWDLVPEHKKKADESDDSDGNVPEKSLTKVQKLKRTMEEEAAEKERLTREEAEQPSLRKMIRDSIPNIYSPTFFYRRLLIEFMKHHRWFGFFTHYDDNMSRATRASVLFMHVTIFMFICVITTVYILHDDGTCYTYVNEEECHATPGRFDVSITYCEYNVFENTCYLRIPYYNPISVCFAFAFAYLATTPLTILCDWAIQKLITSDEVAEQMRTLDALIQDDMTIVAAQGKDAVRKTLLMAHGSPLVSEKRSGAVAPAEAIGALISPVHSQDDGDAQGFCGFGQRMYRALSLWSSSSSNRGMKTAKVGPDPSAGAVLGNVGTGPMTSATENESQGDGEMSASSFDDSNTGRQSIVKLRNQRRSAHIRQAGGLGKRSKKSKKNGTASATEGATDDKVRGEGWQEMKQRKLEEKVLGSTLEEDIAKWNDAIRLFRTMTRLGDDEEGVVDTALYGPHFKKYFDVQEKIRIREKTRYRMFDKDGRFQWPKQSHYNKWFRRFSSAVKPVNEEDDDDDDDETGESQDLQVVPRGRASTLRSGSTFGVVSIAQALQMGNQGKKDARRGLRVAKYMESFTLSFFKRKRKEATDAILRTKSFPKVSQRSLSILANLHLDLISHRMQKIATLKMKRDAGASWELTLSARIFTFVVSLTMLAATCGVAFAFDNARHKFWFYCVLSGLFVNITCIRPFQIVLTQVGIPMLAHDALMKARAFIVESLKSFVPERRSADASKAALARSRRNKGGRRNTVSTQQKLNVVPYLYVSHRIAREFEHYREAQAVRAINSSISQLWLPENRGLSVWNWPDKCAGWFVSQHETVQDWMIATFTELVSVFLVLMVVQLYTWHPAIIPVGIFSYIFAYVSVVMIKYWKDKAAKDRETALALKAKMRQIASAQSVGMKWRRKLGKRASGTASSTEGEEDKPSDTAALSVDLDLELRDEEVIVHDLVETAKGGMKQTGFADERGGPGEGATIDPRKKPAGGEEGLLSEIGQYVKKQEESYDLSKDFPAFDMHSADLKAYMRPGGGHYGNSAVNAASHHMFMRDNIRKHHDEKGEMLYQSAVQTLHSTRQSRAAGASGRPAQKAMRLMFQSAMEALDAGKEGVARQRMGLSAGAAFHQALGKESKGSSASPSKMVAPHFLTPIGIEGPTMMATRTSETTKTSKKSARKKKHRKKGDDRTPGAVSGGAPAYPRSSPLNSISPRDSPVDHTESSVRGNLHLESVESEAEEARVSPREAQRVSTSRMGYTETSSVDGPVGGAPSLVSTRRRIIRGSARESHGSIPPSASEDEVDSFAAVGAENPSVKALQPIVSGKREDGKGGLADADSSDSNSTTSGTAIVPIRKVTSHKKSPPGPLAASGADPSFATPRRGGAGGAPVLSGTKVSGNVSRQKELFAAAMKTLEDKKPAVRPTGGFSAATIGKASYRRDSPLRAGVIQGGADVSSMTSPAVATTALSAASPSGLVTQTDLTAAAGFRGQGPLPTSSHGVTSAPSSSFAAYLAAKKASQKTDSIATSRRVARNRNLAESAGEPPSGNTENKGAP